MTLHPAHLLLLALFACGLSTAAGPDEAPTPAAADAAAPSSIHPGSVEALHAYEGTRAALAADGFEQVGPAAREVATAARAARTGAPAAHEEPLAALATAADQVADAADLAQARVAFGEVSRAAVSLVAADPALAGGRFVFTCPMAPGYSKWVQESDAIDNPYMGARMPACGAASDWSP